MAQDLLELVDETACRRFEKDWYAQRRRPLEEYLPEPGASNFLPTLEELIHIDLELAWESAASHSPEFVADAPTFLAPPEVESYVARFPQLRRDDVLLRLVRQEFSVRLRSGQKPSVAEYRRRFPQLPLSDQSFDTKLLSHCRERTKVTGLGEAPGADLIEETAGSFGGYELMEILGRGGMGIVYRARQRGAEREVALKVIRTSAAEGLSPGEFQGVAERFQIEARAAASLAHDNIVPVYDVGEVGGRHYYAMRLVDGPSLLELARSGPLENRRAAAYAEGAARAIFAAHRQGVLHRDVKPANILIDSQTGRPMVTDFGLAKLLQDTQSVTRSGELIGTPSYMAPEQIDNAASATMESDVYSLGATLYHLLTGRPPFQAASLTDTLWQVKQQEAVSPWLVNAAIDRDLDTICMKCLQKEPSKRYESAEALADDLRRYLNHEPILARPIGNVERARRWARRNPVTARWIGAAAASVLFAVLAIVVGYSSTLAALGKKSVAEQHARNTVNTFYSDVSGNDLLNQPGMQPLRHTLLRRALDYYEVFLREQSGERTIARELAAAAFRAGKITEELESPEKALAYFDRALKQQRELLAENPAHAGDMAALADTLNARGASLRKLQRLDEAMADLKEALQLREKLVKAAPAEAEYERKLANSYMNLGIVAAAQGEFAAARNYAAQGQAIRNRLLKLGPDPKVLTDSGKEHYNLAKLALEENRLEEAQRELKAAIAIFAGRRETNPEDLNNRSLLAMCYRLLGQVFYVSGDPQYVANGLLAYQSAVDTIEALAHENPRVVSYQAELAAVHQELAASLQDHEQWDEALEALAAAARILDPLVTAEPGYRRDAAVVLREIGCIQLNCGKTEVGQESLSKSLARFKELATEFPNDPGHLSDLLETERLMKVLVEKLAQ
jgi:tetratricopeptide (TPR) repeat protein/predicted Ser/Thr protein kinase